MKKIILFCILLCLLVGIVSADTLIVNPTTDAGLERNGVYETWSQITSGSGTGVFPNGESFGSTNELSNRVMTWYSGHYDYNNRAGLCFNTISLGSSSTINSATLDLYGSSVYNSLTILTSVITKFDPGDPTNFVAGDYSNLDNTILASNITYWSVGYYNNFTLNSAGLSYINKSGYTCLGYKSSGDTDGVMIDFGGVDTAYNAFYGSSYGGGTKKPILEIAYISGATAPVSSFTKNHNTLRIPNRITVTDTSTNTPTSWQWSWGDGTANSTTQNPSHQYLKRGVFTINMAATNAGGTGVATAQTVRVVGYQDVQE